MSERLIYSVKGLLGCRLDIYETYIETGTKNNPGKRRIPLSYITKAYRFGERGTLTGTGEFDIYYKEECRSDDARVYLAWSRMNTGEWWDATDYLMKKVQEQGGEIKTEGTPIAWTPTPTSTPAPAPTPAPTPAAAPAASTGGWTCPECGNADVTSNFCPNCGTKKPESSNCPECGHANVTSPFCPECGHRM